MDSVTREDLKRNELGEALGKGMHYAEDHKRMLIWGVGGVVGGGRSRRRCLLVDLEPQERRQRAAGGRPCGWTAPPWSRPAPIPADPARPTFASESARRARAKELFAELDSRYGSAARPGASPSSIWRRSRSRRTTRRRRSSSGRRSSTPNRPARSPPRRGSISTSSIASRVAARNWPKSSRRCSSRPTSRCRGRHSLSARAHLRGPRQGRRRQGLLPSHRRRIPAVALHRRRPAGGRNGSRRDLRPGPLAERLRRPVAAARRGAAATRRPRRGRARPRPTAAGATRSSPLS